MTCSQIPQQANNWSGDNNSRYCNPEYDKQWRSASQELDPKKRQQLFIAMNDLLIKDVAVIPLVHRADVMAFGNSLTGYQPTAWDMRTWDIVNWKRSGK
jgi:peptide/nickel transport system substrate-binding protein